MSALARTDDSDPFLDVYGVGRRTLQDIFTNTSSPMEAGVLPPALRSEHEKHSRDHPKVISGQVAEYIEKDNLDHQMLRKLFSMTRGHFNFFLDGRAALEKNSVDKICLWILLHRRDKQLWKQLLVEDVASRRSRHKKIVFTSVMIEALQNEFNKNRYPDRAQYHLISKNLWDHGMEVSVERVKTWFRNKRKQGTSSQSYPDTANSSAVTQNTKTNQGKMRRKTPKPAKDPVSRKTQPRTKSARKCSTNKLTCQSGQTYKQTSASPETISKQENNPASETHDSEVVCGDQTKYSEEGIGKEGARNESPGEENLSVVKSKYGGNYGNHQNPTSSLLRDLRNGLKSSTCSENSSKLPLKRRFKLHPHSLVKILISRLIVKRYIWNKGRVRTSKKPSSPWFCPLCSLQYATRHRYRTHINSQHHSNTCPVCNKKFSNFRVLKLHYDMHKGLTHRSRDTNLSRREIKENRTGHARQRYHLCNRCGMLFRNRTTWLQHERSHIGERPYTCNMCDKAFVSRSGLKSHFISHTNTRSWPCKVCQKPFKTKNKLDSHMRCHTSEKPYKCDVCQKAFKRSETLHGHRKTHTDKKTFECQSCCKRFRTRPTLQEHIIGVHGERPRFDCQICGQLFSFRSGLRRHRLLRHAAVNAPQYTCDECQKNFPLIHYLTRHMKKNHGIGLPLKKDYKKKRNKLKSAESVTTSGTNTYQASDVAQGRLPSNMVIIITTTGTQNVQPITRQNVPSTLSTVDQSAPRGLAKSYPDVPRTVTVDLSAPTVDQAASIALTTPCQNDSGTTMATEQRVPRTLDEAYQNATRTVTRLDPITPGTITTDSKCSNSILSNIHQNVHSTFTTLSQNAPRTSARECLGFSRLISTIDQNDSRSLPPEFYLVPGTSEESRVRSDAAVVSISDEPALEINTDPPWSSEPLVLQNNERRYNSNLLLTSQHEPNTAVSTTTVKSLSDQRNLSSTHITVNGNRDSTVGHADLNSTKMTTQSNYISVQSRLDDVITRNQSCITAAGDDDVNNQSLSNSFETRQNSLINYLALTLKSSTNVTTEISQENIATARKLSDIQTLSRCSPSLHGNTLLNINNFSEHADNLGVSIKARCDKYDDKDVASTLNDSDHIASNAPITAGLVNVSYINITPTHMNHRPCQSKNNYNDLCNSESQLKTDSDFDSATNQTECHLKTESETETCSISDLSVFADRYLSKDESIVNTSEKGENTSLFTNSLNISWNSKYEDDAQKLEIARSLLDLDTANSINVDMCDHNMKNDEKGRIMENTRSESRVSERSDTLRFPTFLDSDQSLVFDGYDYIKGTSVDKWSIDDI